MSMNCTNTCDICGKVAEAQMNNFSWGRPSGWMTISGLGPIITGDMPLQYQSKQPDMCSWKCVALYAAERAGLTVVP